MKEKIIQFGEGGFLRGFADWLLQIANQRKKTPSPNLKNNSVR